jgi:hypothetical protein
MTIRQECRRRKPSVFQTARKLAQYEGSVRVPATIMAIENAVRWAEEILHVIDERWPVKK